MHRVEAVTRPGLPLLGSATCGGVVVGIRQADGRTLVISPPALTQVTGSPEQFEIRFQPLGAASITLRATGREYGNFGDGIINTLVGDLEIHQGGRPIAQARGTAGLERRAPL